MSSDESSAEILQMYLLRVIFGPFILMRPCGPAGNCIGWKMAFPALAGSLMYAAAVFSIGRALI